MSFWMKGKKLKWLSGITGSIGKCMTWIKKNLNFHLNSFYAGNQGLSPFP